MDSTVNIVNALLDVSSVSGVDDKPQEWFVFRGVVEEESLKRVRIPDYQRETILGKKQNGLIKALKKGTLPDIVLGMRGSLYSQISSDSVPGFRLQSPIYVIDGLQRLSAAIKLSESGYTPFPRLGAMVFVDTTEDWERTMFEDLNQRRTRVSPNVLVYNARVYNSYISTMYNLVESSDDFTLLHGKVQWGQLMKRGHLVTALNLFRMTGTLHARFGTGGRASDVSEIISTKSSTHELMETVGKNIVRENVRTFFGLMDEAFGLSNVHFANSCVFIRGTFICALASFFSAYEAFWNGNRLTVDRATRKKLKQFPISDPTVISLSSGNHSAEVQLRALFLEHIDSGRRTNRLVPQMAPQICTDQSQP